MQVKLITYFKGLGSLLPFTQKYFCSSSGGTTSARYCYSVWMRHLIKAYESGLKSIRSVAELGPGDSLGIGLSAILCGCTSYYGLDAKAHANTRRNREMLDELITLFRRREKIPDTQEFPNLFPELLDYSFPNHILTNEVLKDSLCHTRLADIHKALVNPESSKYVHIDYIAPWLQTSLKKSEVELDMVFSQAVMEHVENVRDTYAALYGYLRPGGLMSHAIDYKSHGYTRDWNGHWTLSEFTWKILKGNRPYLINRFSHSQHITAMKNAGFRIVGEIKKSENPILRQKLAKEFKKISDDDLTTSSAFIHAIKPFNGTVHNN